MLGCQLKLKFLYMYLGNKMNEFGNCKLHICVSKNVDRHVKTLDKRQSLQFKPGWFFLFNHSLISEFTLFDADTYTGRNNEWWYRCWVDGERHVPCPISAIAAQDCQYLCHQLKLLPLPYLRGHSTMDYRVSYLNNSS